MIPDSVYGCKGCDGASGVYGCPTHSPNVYTQEAQKPFVQLIIKCPCCGIGIRFDGYTPIEETVAKMPSIRKC